jgi:PKD repeat protein
MKKLFSFLLVVATLLLSFQSKANEITVKGYVKFANGAKAPNIKVKIFVEAPCMVEHTVTTNNDGFYTDKIRCEGAIKKVRISIQCEGQVLTQLKEVNSNNVAEANFTLCYSPTVCVSRFSFEQLAPKENQKLPVKFNSASAETSREDKIIQRTWDFGDGVIINEGPTDPTHIYEKPGLYNVCLTIKTAKGCSNTKCLPVEVKYRCRADFRFEHTDAGVRFNSGSSTSSNADQIIGRSWNFGDGSPVVKNILNPLHAFPRGGTYNVCLVVWTAGGCESKECKQVVVKEGMPECKARFSFERVAPKKIRFNSNLSIVSTGDEIVEREWEFRDGSANVKTKDVTFAHEFEKAGIYEVCLKIKTAKGCESRFCLAVKVGEEDNDGDGSIKIISLYPIPVQSELKALIYSRTEPVLATISIVDVYGQIKWSKQVWLAKGHNPIEIPTSSLLAGPYFFRVVTGFGIKSKRIYKI